MYNQLGPVTTTPRFVGFRNMLQNLENLKIKKKKFSKMSSGFRDIAKRIFRHLREFGLASTGQWSRLVI